MTLHLVRIAGITTLVVLGILYPFLPGGYDSLAMALSIMAQAFGVLGQLLVLVGILWLAYELRKRARSKRNLPTKARGYYFGLASVIAASIVAVALCLVAVASVGFSLGLLTLALWLYIVSRLIQRLKRMKKAEAESFNPAPVYLVFIPIVVLLFQVKLAAPVTEYSRNQAIENSAELINDIEEYHARQRRYPSSLAAIWKDYYPSVVGIDRFQYAPNGEAYDLFFEQPRFLLDNLGTREFVVYNKLDEQTMISHTGWILGFTPEELEVNQGWYSAHDTSILHWKYFWFD